MGRTGHRKRGFWLIFIDFLSKQVYSGSISIREVEDEKGIGRSVGGGILF